MKQPVPKAVLQDHRLWLESDGEQGKRADLWNADLWNADLQGANLRGANLQGADLRGANLTGVNLMGPNLRGASLQGANLRSAKFTTNFKRVGWFDDATFSEEQIPWVVLNRRYPTWAGTLKWAKAEAEAA